MAIALLFEVPGFTQQHCEQVRHKVCPDNRPPAGMLYHVAGPMEGGWRVFEVWESQEAADRFFREKLGQALQATGVPNTQPSVSPVHNIMQP